jgi:hypothetical protein
MDCRLIEPELVAFHFGADTGAPRGEIEEHLLTCPACLRSYLAAKRAAEAPAEASPSPAARARLRRSVARELGVADAAGWSWWERPLAFGMAVASFAACVAVWQSIAPLPLGCSDESIGEYVNGCLRAGLCPCTPGGGAAPYAPGGGAAPYTPGGGSAPYTPGGALPLHPGQEKRG